MSKVLGNFLLVIAAFLSSTLVLSSVGSAAEEQTAPVVGVESTTPTAVDETTQVKSEQSEAEDVSSIESLSSNLAPFSSANTSSEQDYTIAQVTSVSQLSDVQPTDWAFQALQSLVERYGCIAGYPDRTYRGNRSLTRYEFAAGLNACLDRVNELIAAGTQDLVTKEDLAKLQRLREEFAGELTTLRGRIDAVEAQAAQLEANQFSTTTKLNAEVVLGLSSVLGGDRSDGQPADKIPTLNARVRLNFDTSFTGRDRLRVRLQASNVVPLSAVLLTNEGRLNYDGNTNNNAVLQFLQYRLPLGEQTSGYVGLVGNGFVDFDFTGQLNPYFEGGTSISAFGLRNPIYTYAGGAGVGLRHQFNDVVELDVGYLASNAGEPTEKRGLFDGRYAGIAQLIVTPNENFGFGFTYLNTYSSGSTVFGPASRVLRAGSGSNLANSNFGSAVVANGYALSASIRVSPAFTLGGWVSYVTQRYINRGDGEVWTWAATLAFPDLGSEGSVLGFLVGMEPHLTSISNNINGGQADRDTSLHIDAFYKYQLTDNISITPGVIWLTAPNHDARNDDAFIGVIRTVFRF